nr:isochorismatase family protein [Halalkalibacterium ligniniphilum]
MKEAASLLGISTATLRRLEKDEEVKGYGIRVYYTPGGQRRYLKSEIEQFYLNNKGFAGRIGFGERPALLVIDCINAFTSKQSPLSGDWDEEIKKINMLITAAHKAGCPVIFSHSYYVGDSQGMHLFSKKIKGIEALELNSDGVKLDPRMKAIKSDNHIYSKFLSVYYQTELLEILENNHCDTLIISGFSTSGSVRVVASETIQYGIKPIVPLEAVGDRDIHVHRNNLADIERKVADVLPVTEIIDYLNSK